MSIWSRSCYPPRPRRVTRGVVAGGAGYGQHRDSGLRRAGTERLQQTLRTDLLSPAAAIQQCRRLRCRATTPRQRSQRRWWEQLILQEIERQQKLGKELWFRADSAFGKPDKLCGQRLPSISQPVGRRHWLMLAEGHLTQGGSRRRCCGSQCCRFRQANGWRHRTQIVLNIREEGEASVKSTGCLTMTHPEAKKAPNHSAFQPQK